MGERLTQSYLDSLKVGVLMVEAGVEGGRGGVHSERYLDSMRVGVLMVEGGGGEAHTELFGQFEGRSTHG